MYLYCGLRYRTKCIDIKDLKSYKSLKKKKTKVKCAIFVQWKCIAQKLHQKLGAIKLIGAFINSDTKISFQFPIPEAI